MNAFSFRSSIFGLLLVSLTACDHDKIAVSEPMGPSVVADDVVFPPDSKQAAQFIVNEACDRSKPVQHFYGRVVLNEEVTVRVFSPIAGRVESIRADLGKPVQAGEVLATLLSPDFGQAQADCRKAVADLAQAERVFLRTKDLAEHGAAAQKEVEAAQADVDRAKTEKSRTEVKLAQFGGSKAELDGTYALTSPIGGIITDRTLNVGQEVRPDQMLANIPGYASPLFVVSNPKKLWVMLEVTERDLPKLAAGDQLTLRSAAFGQGTGRGR